MRVLFATPFVPWPLDSGGRLRAFHLARAAAEQVTVELHAVAEPRDLTEARRALEPHFDRVVLHPRSRPSPLARLARAKPERWFQSRAFEVELDRRAEESIVLHLEEVFLARSVPAALRPHTLVGHQKIDSAFHARTHPAPTPAQRLEGHRLARLEAFAAKHFRNHLCCSAGDADLLAGRFPDLSPDVLPSGFDPGHLSSTPDPRTRADGPLLLLGSLDYGPNADAAEHFVRDVLPLVLETQPQVRVQLVGRNPSERVRALVAGPSGGSVELHADVPDVRPFLERASALLVPLRIGGGTRLKIVEALAVGCPVISTTVGAEGLDLVHGEHLTLADDPRALADAIRAHRSDPTRAARLAAAGRERVHDRYTWNRLAERLIESWRPLSSALTPHRP